MSLLPIVDIPVGLCRKLTHFFCDIDDTLTQGGLLTPESFGGLWDLHRAGIAVVPVTGRPAGWCDHIARMWPVSGVIGENGAFYFAYDRDRRKMRRFFLLSEADRLAGQEKLERIRRRALAEVPGCGISADQPYRLVDLAIDFCEDVPRLTQPEIDHLCRIIAEEGARYKISSIHINCWYGPHDKVSGVREFLKLHDLNLEQDLQQRSTFIGDSPNDEPMFAHLEHAIAVANIRPYLDRLSHPPAYITEQKSALGFSEAVRTILSKRGS